MALSSATNPVVDGVLTTVNNLTITNSDNVANQIWPSNDSVAVIGVKNGVHDYVILPALASVPRGHTIVIDCIASSDFQMRTPASSTEKINNVNCDGTNQYLMTDTQVVKVIKISNTVGWVAIPYTKLGAVATAIVPVGHSFSPSLSPSISPSVSPSSSASSSVSPSSSASASVSPSVSKSPSLSPSVSPSVSVSPSTSVSPSSSKSPSVSPSSSISPSLSPSQ